MAVPHENWSISNLDTSDRARVHIGHHNEYHDHRYYGDESQFSPSERRRMREDAILSSLYSTDMTARERAIDSPCSHTFGWIFDERVTERERHDGRLTFFDEKVRESKHYDDKEIRNLMSRWLEHEHGIFFIVGKAGSGKSTLMRFLAEHKQTSTLLHIWARRQDCALTICAHYFWCSGSELQSSQEGLWRSILYAIAKKDRKLASAMFTDRACDDGQTLAHLRSQPWARNDLIRALSLLVGQLEVQKVAICLFIDGLDEYQGDEMMLIAELRQLLVSPCIKICASSRPRNLFEQAFGHKDQQWKLALHRLTQGDMVQLARTRLYEDDAFCKLVDCGDRRQSFVTAITDRSQGVFLWTVLVVREMIREAHQAGTIDELRARLDALPDEIGGKKGMYERIFERSDPRYRKYMARLVLIMLEARHGELFWEDVHFLYSDTEDTAFATQDCLGLDDKYRVACDKERENSSLQSYRPLELKDTSCRGLFLACHQGHSGVHPRGLNCQAHLTSLIDDTRQQICKWCPDFVDTNNQTTLGFFHLSVGEYLSLPEIRERMTGLAGRGFDPVLTRCRLRLAHLRLGSQRRMEELGRSFLLMVASIGYERRDFVRTILPEFERIQDTKWSFTVEGHNVLDRLWARSLSNYMAYAEFKLHGGFDISRSSHAHAWFLSLAAQQGLAWYCHEHCSQIPTSDRQAAGTVIIASILFCRTRLPISKEQVDLVKFLLRSGTDPNTRYTWRRSSYNLKASLWEAYLEECSAVWRFGFEDRFRETLIMMQLMLLDGRADRKCCLPAGHKSFLSVLTAGTGYDNNGQLHRFLDAHGLLTPQECRVARKQGWIPTKLTTPRTVSATV